MLNGVNTSLGLPFKVIVNPGTPLPPTILVSGTRGPPDLQEQYSSVRRLKNLNINVLKLYLVYVAFYLWEPLTPPPNLEGIMNKTHQQLVTAVLVLLGVRTPTAVSFQ
jgi:hypothetical protein